MSNEETSIDLRRVPEEVLLTRVQQGDKAAFSALVAARGASLLRYARTVCADHARAQDAVQDALLSIWRYRGPAPDKPNAWLMSIVRNAASRQFRGAAHGGREDATDVERDVDAGWGDAQMQTRALARLEDREQIERGLAALSPADREILLLSDCEELTIDEMSAILGLQAGAVKSRVHRARLRFVAALSKGDLV
jgi:RNA polymerase sigma-70 factor (ECF subfamily)